MNSHHVVVAEDEQNTRHTLPLRVACQGKEITAPSLSSVQKSVISKDRQMESDVMSNY